VHPTMLRGRFLTRSFTLASDMLRHKERARSIALPYAAGMVASASLRNPHRPRFPQQMYCYFFVAGFLGAGLTAGVAGLAGCSGFTASFMGAAFFACSAIGAMVEHGSTTGIIMSSIEL
jgi:hypothetical protein